MYLSQLVKWFEEFFSKASQMCSDVWHRILNDPVWTTGAIALLALLAIMIYLKYRATGGK